MAGFLTRELHANLRRRENMWSSLQNFAKGLKLDVDNAEGKQHVPDDSDAVQNAQV